MNKEQKLSNAETQLEIDRLRVANCKSPSSFDSLYYKFLEQEIIVKGLKNDVDDILNSN